MGVPETTKRRFRQFLCKRLAIGWVDVGAKKKKKNKRIGGEEDSGSRRKANVEDSVIKGLGPGIVMRKN